MISLPWIGLALILDGLLCYACVVAGAKADEREEIAFRKRFTERMVL